LGGIEFVLLHVPLINFVPPETWARFGAPFFLGGREGLL